MRAKDEIAKLQAKIEEGTLDPDEPLFTLRAQDELAADHVREWVVKAKAKGTPPAKLEEALQIARMMADWPTKQTPGKPETRQTQST